MRKPQSKDYIRMQNRKEHERQKARRRAKPSHPCHRFPDDTIYQACDKIIRQRLVVGKDTVDRDDIFFELVCGDTRNTYKILKAGPDKTYLKVMITQYMDERYPVRVAEKRRRVWTVSPVQKEMVPA